MLPNQASNSRSNSSSETKSLASGRSLARIFFGPSFVLPLPASNELLPAAIAFLLRGSTLTLYGGSVLTKWIFAPASSRSTSSAFDRVATQQTVVAEDPKVAGLRDRFVRRFGNIVRIGQSLLDAGIEQLGEFIGIETKQFAIETDCLQFADFDRQQVVVPLRVLAGSVVGDAVGLDRFGLHVLGDMDWDLGESQLLSRPSTAYGRR